MNWYKKSQTTRKYPYYIANYPGIPITRGMPRQPGTSWEVEAPTARDLFDQIRLQRGAALAIANQGIHYYVVDHPGTSRRGISFGEFFELLK